MTARAVQNCLVVVLTLAGFQPVMAQDCGARSLEWHEAYENGRRALSRGKPMDATDCFERAIEKRPNPGTNLLIYGTNVLSEYYPYVRLAEAQLLSGDPDAATRTLERSVAVGQEPESERARVAAQIEEALVVLRPTPRPTPVPTPEATPVPTPASTGEPTATAAQTPEPTVPPTPEPKATPGPPAEATPRRVPTLPTPTPLPTPAQRTPLVEPDVAPAEREPTAAPQAGELELTSEPGGARVFLDGVLIGMTPEGNEGFTHDVSPGPHEVRLVLEDHRDAIALLDFAPGERIRVRERLLPHAKEPSDSNLLNITIALAIGTGLFLVAWAWRRLFAASSVALQDAETMAQRPDLTPTSELPARFGEFTLVSRLGRGGMASVYRAERAGEAAVALKRPQESFLGEEQFIERFLREAELGRALNHPNIIRIFERGEVAGVPYFTMQLLEGATLWHALRAQGRFDPERAVRTVVQVAEGLDFAHSKGVVHRDLKPSNIWLDPDGRIVVMDFGIARARRFEGMTGTGAFLGTPEYISPEVIDGEAASPASDMYALGVIFYELVTGRRPFAGESAFAIFKQHRVTEPEPPSRLAPRLPPELEGIMLALLAKRPADRPASAEALVVSLRDYLNRFQAS